jgi:hypothetical protein
LRIKRGSARNGASIYYGGNFVRDKSTNRPNGNGNIQLDKPHYYSRL